MIGAKKRFQVLQRDNFRCYYCGKNGKDVSLEVDHIIPKSKGGTDEFDNLITCCRECNIGKGNEIIGVDVNIGKLKAAEHESKMIKWFFKEWNELGNGEINKRNITFISGFIKLYYGDYLKGFINMYIREGNISESGFDKGDTECDNLLDMFDTYAIDDLSYILENIEENNQNYGNGWTRYTDDYNERLNRLITYQMVWLKFPKSFIYKYSLCPNKVEEWEKDRDEQLGVY